MCKSITENAKPQAMKLEALHLFGSCILCFVISRYSSSSLNTSLCLTPFSVICSEQHSFTGSCSKNKM